MTKNQAAWKKEIRRIQRFMKNAAKRGYSFSGVQLPTQPKRITAKSLQQLKGLTPAALYQKAKYKQFDGTVISGTQRRQHERQIAYLKGKQTKLLKKEIEEYIKSHTKKEEFFDAVIHDVGQEGEIIESTIVFIDGHAVDSETGEILFEVTDELPVINADEIIKNYKKLLGLVKGEYQTKLLTWINTLVKVLGKERVAKTLENLAHLGKLVQRAARYENDFVFYTWEHMNSFIQEGYMDRDIAESIMEEFSNSQDAYFEDGTVI